MYCCIMRLFDRIIAVSRAARFTGFFCTEITPQKVRVETVKQKTDALWTMFKLGGQVIYSE